MVDKAGINWQLVPDIPIAKNGEYKIELTEEFPFLLEFYEFPQKFNSVPNFHDFFEVCWVYDGEGVYTIDDKEYVVRTNDVFVVSSYKMHSIETFETNTLKLVCAVFMPELVYSNANDLFDFEYLLPFYFNNKVINHLIPANNCISSVIIQHMKTIRAHIASDRPSVHYHTKAQLLSILANLIDFYHDTIYVDKTKITDKLGVNKLKEVFDYIHKNFNQNIQLKELACILGCSEEYLGNNFKQVAGIKITDYIIQYRLNAAKRLLAFSKSTIAEIAYETGFNSPNYFNRVFKNYHKTSPGEYRAQFN